MRTLLVTCAVLAMCLGVTRAQAPASASPRADGSTVTICDQYGCRTIVTNNGKPKRTGNNGGNDGGAVTTTCSWKGDTVPCSDPRTGSFDRRDGCYYRVADPMPTSGPILQEYKRNGGGIYWATCPFGNGSGGYVWLAQPPAAVGPTPAELAQRAAASFRFPAPSGHRSPSESLRYQGYAFSYVNLWLYFWTDATTWKTLSATARVGNVWATVTAEPTALSFSPGDGSSATSCAGPGRAWSQADGNAPPSRGACGYRYRGVTTAPVTTTQRITWKISWRGSGGTAGTLPRQSRAVSSQLQVMQIETVATR